MQVIKNKQQNLLLKTVLLYIKLPLQYNIENQQYIINSFKKHKMNLNIAF